MFRYRRILLRWLRKAKGLIQLSLHLLPHSYEWQLLLPGNRLTWPSQEDDSSTPLVSDSSAATLERLIDRAVWKHRDGTVPFVTS